MATISIILMRVNWPNFSRCQISGGFRISEGESPGYMPRIITGDKSKRITIAITIRYDSILHFLHRHSFILSLWTQNLPYRKILSAMQYIVSQKTVQSCFRQNFCVFLYILRVLWVFSRTTASAVFCLVQLAIALPSVLMSLIIAN